MDSDKRSDKLNWQDTTIHHHHHSALILVNEAMEAVVDTIELLFTYIRVFLWIFKCILSSFIT